MAGAATTKKLRPGDMVRVRSAREILATLDEAGAVDGVPFMPEMLRYVDRRFRVSKRVEKICCSTDESLARALPSTVLLEDLRCDGSGHGNCQAECRIYWKEVWLEPVEGREPLSHSDDAYLEELRRLVEAGTRSPDSPDEATGEEVFRCQITESVHASTPLQVRELGQYVAEVRSGNVGLIRFLRVAFRMVWWRVIRRFGRTPDMPELAGADRVDGEKLDLEAGELVEVRSLDEIGQTLDENARHRGLAFTEELAPACGKRFRVRNRVDRLIDERTGKMIQLKNDCIVLDGFVCSGDRTEGALFCPREAYPLFREAWLSRVGSKAETGSSASASAEEH
jgi:hypothetical protein